MKEFLKNYHRTSREPAVMLMWVLPIFLAYSIGQVAVPRLSITGIDVLSPVLREHLGSSGFVLVHLGVAAGAACYILYRLGRGTLTKLWHASPLVLESLAYGLLLGTTVLFLMDETHLLAAGVGKAPAPNHWVRAAGAGLYEECVFRLLLIPALAMALCRWLAMPKMMAWGLAIIGSSLLFAAAHHWAGEPFTTYAFAFRSIAGAIFAGLFLFRGIAVTIWTHTFYDYYVTAL